MEHRWDVRRTVFLDVDVYHLDSLVARASSGDVSRGGLFLEDSALDLPVNAPVELDVLLKLEQGSVGFHFNASVIHCARGGIGLMFRKTRAQLANTLMELLSDNKVLAKSLSDGGVDGTEVWKPARSEKPASRVPLQFF